MITFRQIPRNVWVLSAVSFLRDIASEMLVHLVPLFLTNVLGVRISFVGLIEGIAATTASATMLYSGWLSDRMGQRKRLTVMGYALAAAATPLLLIARSWPAVLLYRFLDRMGKGIRTAPRDALIADSIAPGQRGISFGLHRAADSGGAFIGLLVAIAIVWIMQADYLALTANTFRLAVLWALIPATLAAVIVALLVREPPRTHTSPGFSFSLQGLSPSFYRFLLVMALFSLGNSSDAFMVLRAQHGGVTVLMILMLIAFFNLTYTIGAIPAGALSDRIDRRYVILGGWLLYAFVYFGFARATQAWHFWLLYGLYGVYYALTEGVAKAIVADVVPEVQRRGSAYGIFHATLAFTALPASLLAGILWQGVGSWPGFGPQAPFLCGGLLALVAALLMWFWVVPPSHHRSG